MAYYKEIEEYIKKAQVSRISKEAITSNLLGAGWSQVDINDSYAVFNAPVTERESVKNARTNTVYNTVFEAPVSPRTITQEEYPVTILWVFKFPIIIIFVSIVALVFGYWFPDLIFITPGLFIYYLYQRRKVKFTLGVEYVTASGVTQIRKGKGIQPIGKDKKHQLDIPYSSVNNVVVQQDLFDMVFGIGNVLVDLSEEKEIKKKGFIEEKLAPLFVGRLANSKKDNFIIPGLTKRGAEAVCGIILDRSPTKSALESGAAISN